MSTHVTGLEIWCIYYHKDFVFNVLFVCMQYFVLYSYAVFLFILLRLHYIVFLKKNTFIIK
jgi:hypothetical protein